MKNFVRLSPRVLLLQLNIYHRTPNLIQVYASTADKDDDVLEEFYRDLGIIMKLTKSEDVLGDLNAKIGEGQRNQWIGQFELGNRNERGDCLVQFCQEYYGYYKHTDQITQKKKIPLHLENTSRQTP